MKLFTHTLTSIALILIFGCNSNQKTKENYYPSGNLKSIEFTNKNGKLDSIKSFYDEDKLIKKRKLIRKNNYDSLIVYYKNGNKYKTGKQEFDGKYFGNWIRYTKEGYKSSSREYFIIKNKSSLNRNFYFNKKGDTVWHASKFNRYNQKEFIKDTLYNRISTMNFIKIHPSNSINLGNKIVIEASINSSSFPNQNSEIIVFLSKQEKMFNKDFSNIKEVELDSFKNLSYTKKYQDVYSKDYWNHTAIFDLKFKTAGEKTLKGYIKEFTNTTSTKDGGPISSYALTYFEKKIYIKDTIN